MNLTVTKTRLKGAQTGHSLLKKKAQALQKRFRALLSRIQDVRFPIESVCCSTIDQERPTAGEAQDGTSDAARGLLARRSHIRDRRHLVPDPRGHHRRNVPRRSPPGERIGRHPSRVRARSLSGRRWERWTRPDRSRTWRTADYQVSRDVRESRRNTRRTRLLTGSPLLDDDR